MTVSIIYFHVALSLIPQNVLHLFKKYCLIIRENQNIQLEEIVRYKRNIKHTFSALNMLIYFNDKLEPLYENDLIRWFVIIFLQSLIINNI